MHYQRYKRRPQRIFFPHRSKVMIVVTLIIFSAIIGRLFQLQVIYGSDFKKLALSQRSSKIEIPARRGEILVRDTATGDLVKLATNTTLNTVFVDPLVTPDKEKVAKILSSLLFSPEDFSICLENIKFCPTNSLKIKELKISLNEKNEEQKEEIIRILEDKEIFNDDIELDKEKIIFPSFEEALESYRQEILEKISHEKINFSVLKRNVSLENMEKVEKLFFPGIEVLKKKSIVYADPTKISKSSHKEIAKKLALILDLSEKFIIKKITGGSLRYIPIKRRISPNLSEKIKDIKKIFKEQHQEDKFKILNEKSEREPVPNFFRGVGLQQEHLRYYPDNSLAAQIIGFVNHKGIGQYGIEGKWDSLLAGKKGLIESQNDVSGMQITMGAEKVQDAEDGSSIVLTIDRIVQKKVEEILKQKVEDFHADSGQVLIADPFTGEIIAMANYPTFNPNYFGNVYLKRKTEPEDSKKIFKTTPLFKKNKEGKFITSNFEEFEQAWKMKFNPEFYVYKNWSGPAAYINKTVQAIYEPGSVFKPLAMAAALDSKEVTPSTRYREDGPIEVGKFKIHTATDEYRGWQTITNALDTSSNIGMAFVALKLGRAVFHKYIKEFGFGEFTDIGLENELPGTVKFYKKWSDALLITSSFGQGLDATPLQMVSAWCALANGGILVKPYIVSAILKKDKILQERKPEKIRHVISPDTSVMITSMLVSAVNNGVAFDAKVEGYNIAGKTGTSQIARTDGVGYEDTKKPGSVITSFVGYAPIKRPRFVMLVKFDRPRQIGGRDNIWGSTTAAPTFKEIATFLFDYYGILPD